MTLVNSIKEVVEWLNKNVCDKITLKLPDDYKNDAGYDVEFVHPAAFPLYVPGKELKAPNIPAPIPSICVQLMEGSDDLLKKQRRLQIRFCLACWNPGEHGGELKLPRANENALGGYTFYNATGEAAKTYTRNMEGWRDSLNLLDLVLRELEGTEYIAGHHLLKEEGIKFGPFTEEGSIVDYYPYWHNWITFTLEAGAVVKPPEIYKDFL